MNRIILLLFLVSQLCAKDVRPDGGYLSWSDFVNGKVTIPAKNLDVRVISPMINFISIRKHITNDRCKIRYINSKGRKKKWNTKKHGDLQFIKKGNEYYYAHVGVRINLQYPYAWYVEVTNESSGSGMDYHRWKYETVMVIDFENEVIEELNSYLLKQILSKDEELLKEYLELPKKSKNTNLLYFEKYLTRLSTI